MHDSFVLLSLDLIYQSLLLFPLVLSVYLSYKILKCTDMTVEGSYVLGASLFARLILETKNYPLSFIIGGLGGLLSGALVGLIQKDQRMSSLLASIIMLFILTGVNLEIMGMPNINLLQYPIAPSLALSVLFLVIFWLFIVMYSNLGLRFKAIGSNRTLFKRLGYFDNTTLCLGLGLSNCMASIAGVINAQVNGYSDVFMGQGLSLTSVGIVIVGLRLVKSCRPSLQILGCFMGVFLYQLFLNMFIRFGYDTVYLKTVLGIMLIFVLSKGGNYERRSD